MANEVITGGNFGNGNGNNGNFDLQQLMNITGQTALNINHMSKQMGIMATAVDNMRTDLDGLTGRMDRLEQKEEISTAQKEAMKRALYKRCYEITGEDPLEIKKYFGSLVARCWSDAKKEAGVGARYEETKKENFQRAIDFFERWSPKEGCANFKDAVDIKAEARRKAKELGYK